MLPMTSTIWAYNEFLTDGLFKGAEFPAGIDKETIINTIMLKYGELEPLYKDADFMQWACTSWSKKWYHSFDRWYIALSEEYNPLHNYDRYEDINENTNSNGNNKSTSTNTRSSFDSSNYEPHDRNSYDGDSSATGSLNHNAHMYGNIGVTTSAQMLEGELEVRKNNIYDLIADCFATELCLMVY